MSTPTEQILDRVRVVLDAALSASVARRRTAAWEPEELPAVEIFRGDIDSEAFSDHADKSMVSFRISYFVLESSSAETQLDALHQSAYSALQADAALVSLGRGLRCTSTGDPQSQACGDGTCARMDAQFLIQTLSRRADLAAVR